MEHVVQSCSARLHICVDPICQPCRKTDAIGTWRHSDGAGAKRTVTGVTLFWSAHRSILLPRKERAAVQLCGLFHRFNADPERSSPNSPPAVPRHRTQFFILHQSGPGELVRNMTLGPIRFLDHALPSWPACSGFRIGYVAHSGRSAKLRWPLHKRS